MKLLLSRSLFTAFLVVAGLASVYAQTTVTLPTIPCSNCNGPGAFATTAPGCTSGLVGAPLTMSWGTASGATSYTIMIATDGNLSQNVATFTTTSTSISVPAIGLAPSITYYWTVFANNASGSTKATGGVCTFSTNTTWTGGSATGGFPNGSLSQQVLNNGIAGGYYDCRSGDGTCASGDNLVCNPNFLNAGGVAPNWYYTNLWAGSQNVVVRNFVGSTGLSISGASGLTTGATIPAQYTYWNGVGQQMIESNSTNAVKNYRLRFWAKSTGGNTLLYAGFQAVPGNYYGLGVSQAQLTLASVFTYYDVNVTLPANTSAGAFYIVDSGATTNATINVTGVWLCAL